MARKTNTGLDLLRSLSARLGSGTEVTQNGGVKARLYRGYGFVIRERIHVNGTSSNGTGSNEAGVAVYPDVVEPEPAPASADLLSLAGHLDRSLAEPPPSPLKRLKKSLEELENALSGDRERALRALGTPVALYSILVQKRIAVVGFPPYQSVFVAQVLTNQLSTPVILSHEEADDSIGNCDLCIVNAHPSLPAAHGVPVLVVGDASRLATDLVPGGAVDFVPEPWNAAHLAWRAAAHLARGQNQAEPPEPVRPKEPEHLPTRPPSIVIADDDATIRTLLTTVLTQEGMECHPADNGGTALELIKTKRPDAVILDLGIPCLDGFQVLSAIRQDAQLSGVRVIILTARQAEVDILRGFGLGADDYITKPFSPMELGVRLKRLVGRTA